MEAITETPIFAPLFNRKHLKFGLWCNGSTTGFGSVCPGSNPGSPTTNRQKPQEKISWGFFFSSMLASAASECMKPTRPLSIYQFITMQIDNIIRQYVCDIPILLRIKFLLHKTTDFMEKQYLCVAFKTSLNLYIDSCI